MQLRALEESELVDQELGGTNSGLPREGRFFRQVRASWWLFCDESRKSSCFWSGLCFIAMAMQRPLKWMHPAALAVSASQIP